MNVLITGASGFLGNYIYKKLTEFNYEIDTLSHEGSGSKIECNLAEVVPIFNENYDLVVHAAGKAHSIPKSNKEEMSFFNVNFHGTQNLLRGLERSKTIPKSLIFISSVAVYGKEKGNAIKENCLLEAEDPYGKSKVLAERYILDWGEKYKVGISIIRPSLIFGKDAPGNLKNMIEAIKSRKYLNISKGKARRSIVLAEDIAEFIPRLTKHPGIYNLTDGYHPSFIELSKNICKRYNRKVFSIPLPIAKVLANIGDFLMYITKKNFPFNSIFLSKMTNDLTFDDSKAKSIGWNPKKVIEYSDKWLD